MGQVEQALLFTWSFGANKGESEVEPRVDLLWFMKIWNLLLRFQTFMNHNKTSDSLLNWAYFHCFIYVTFPWMTHWNHPPQLRLLSSGVNKNNFHHLAWDCRDNSLFQFISKWHIPLTMDNEHVLTVFFVKILNNWPFWADGPNKLWGISNQSMYWDVWNKVMIYFQCPFLNLTGSADGDGIIWVNVNVIHNT